MTTNESAALDVLDWRRRVGAIYAAVRASDDPRAAHRIWSSGRAELLRSHPASPVARSERAAYQGPDIAAYDEAFRFKVSLDTSSAPAHFEVETGTDGLVRFDRIGVADLGAVGALDVWWLASYGGGLFIPVKDALAGSTTYGGGRYLIDTVKGADLGGELPSLVIDFNFAYNPSCAYDPAWACPLAPAGNVIDVELGVGELMSTPGA